MLDSAYIAALNAVTKAEIYLPIEKESSLRKFGSIDLSRETFGKVYNALRSRAGKGFASIFDLYEKINANGINFATFYAAIMVFTQLNIIYMTEAEQTIVHVNKSQKVQLNESKLYNTLNLLKNTYRRSDGK